MRLPRVFCPGMTSEFQLNEEAAHHLVGVLRLKAGHEFLAFDGTGQEARTRILQTRPHVLVEVLEVCRPQVEPEVSVTLFLALVKGERFDWAVEKSTELGVSSLVPMVTRRTEVRHPGEERRGRWQRLAVSAAAQSGRVQVPEIETPLDFAQALDRASGFEQAFLLKPGGVSLPGSRADRVALLVGPEGGFSDEEVREAQVRGLLLVGLGPRTLRVETAALAALARIIQT
ncbi:MAG: 16S rRNA (uracil(1498)-N(3))-methyltransferase [Candidatus Xenobium sp.]